MRTLFLFAVSIILFSSCGKDKFTSDPQVKFNSISPNAVLAGSTGTGPFLSIQLTDAEGDFGFKDDSTVSYVFVKNLTIPPFDIDSFPFPSASEIKRKDLNAEVTVDLASGRGILVGTQPPPVRPYTDTLYFQVYVKDFAKHKSNVIRTGEPLYFITQ